MSTDTIEDAAPVEVELKHGITNIEDERVDILVIALIE